MLPVFRFAQNFSKTDLSTKNHKTISCILNLDDLINNNFKLILKIVLQI